MAEKILVLMRHSKALNTFEANVNTDFERPLSTEGVAKAEHAVKELKSQINYTDAIAASPLVRAKQTADIAAKTFGIKDTIIMPELADSMDADAYRDAVKTLSEQYSSVIVVAHNPAISVLAREYTGQDIVLSPGDFKIIKLN